MDSYIILGTVSDFVTALGTEVSGPTLWAAVTPFTPIIGGIFGFVVAYYLARRLLGGASKLKLKV